MPIFDFPTKGSLASKKVSLVSVFKSDRSKTLSAS